MTPTRLKAVLSGTLFALLLATSNGFATESCVARKGYGLDSNGKTDKFVLRREQVERLLQRFDQSIRSSAWMSAASLLEADKAGPVAWKYELQTYGLTWALVATGGKNLKFTVNDTEFKPYCFELGSNTPRQLVDEFQANLVDGNSSVADKRSFFVEGDAVRSAIETAYHRAVDAARREASADAGIRRVRSTLPTIQAPR